MSFGVSTTTRTFFEYPTLFPKVTFCNFNWFTTEYAYNQTRENIFYGNYLLSDEDKRKLGHDLGDILLECSFNNNRCHTNGFKWSYDDDYGNCYTFNSGEIDLKKTANAGLDSSLRLAFYVNIYEELLHTYDDLMKT